MIAQALVIVTHKVLMVRQHVMRGDIVWNFPGGGMEPNETAEQACLRELKEETGYDGQITELLVCEEDKYTFVVELIGGELFLDREQECNQDILEVQWIGLNEHDKFDSYTKPILDLYRNKKKGRLPIS